MLTDIEIAKSIQMRKITEIAEALGISDSEIELYGSYKAKLNHKLEERVKQNKQGKLVLVTAINPTPAGEGKTTVTIGLGQAMNKIGKKTIIALREPSLGPVFGMKGGAAGGGYSQVLPMEDINLHFTGDMHAITSANNLLCAMLDNHIHHGNSLRIDAQSILIKRCLDMNDRALRDIVIGLGGKANGITREDGFIITVASEVMAILCLAKDTEDLKVKLGDMLVAYNVDGEPVYAKDLKAADAMAILLKDAIMPNLVQTIEGTPAIIHGGPFANIAHGCNSVRATELALKLSDFCVTEAGFGSDLGAEKFFDIKCRKANLKPSVVVLVATVRALKYNGEGILEKGIVNLDAHIDNMRKFGIPVVVAVNKFSTDTRDELEYIRTFCEGKKVKVAFADVFAQGGEGGKDLAHIVCEQADEVSNFKLLYDEEMQLEDKIDLLAKDFYGAKNVVYTKKAERALKKIKAVGGDKLPVCVAKTQYSMSDDPTKLGRPKGFEITVSDVKLSNGAGFVVVFTGNIMTMPGLPKIPAAQEMTVSNAKEICGLF